MASTPTLYTSPMARFDELPKERQAEIEGFLALYQSSSVFRALSDLYRNLHLESEPFCYYAASKNYEEFGKENFDPFAANFSVREIAYLDSKGVLKLANPKTKKPR